MGRNLLYVQTVAEVEWGWVSTDADTRARLTMLQVRTGRGGTVVGVSRGGGTGVEDTARGSRCHGGEVYISSR